MLHLRHAVAGLVCAAGCAPPAPPAPAAAASPAAAPLRFDVAAIDPAVDACHDFYDHACGGWRRSHPIPPDRTRWSRYAEVEALNLERERAIVEAAARAAAGRTDPATARVGNYYAACLDTAAIEARGTAPIRDLVAAIDAIRDPAAVAGALAELHARIGPLVFSLDTDVDADDVHRTTAQLGPGELGLGEPDDYTRDDARSRTLRAQYRDHVERVLRLAGDADPPGDAARAVALETQLAQALPGAAARRDRAAQIHPMTAAELTARAGFDGPRYVAARGVPGLDRINVAFVGLLDAIGAQLTPAGLAGVRAYLRFHVARRLAPVLPSAFREAFFDFEGRIVRGAREMPPRWRRCLQLVDRDLGDDVGRLFVARWFPAASQARARQLVDRVAGSLRQELAASDWLGGAARDAALAKLANMRFQIGYSDHWKAYDALVIRRDDPVGNAVRASQLATARELAKLGHPPDRDEFFGLPQELNGFGTPTLVTVGFTAGFLQPPVFDPAGDDAVNFGAFGGVIGHEITHHFDDQGRKYAVDGRLAPWWSADDVARYEARAACFVGEYAGFHIDDGTPVDGALTLGENLADNGGLQLAWQAAQPALAGPPIDGFTPAQRFFLAWAQIRCENATPETARALVHRDPHAPGRWRVNGVVANMPAFAEAFGCKPGAPMAPEQRCRLW